MSVEKVHARAFYEAEAIRGGWSVRQLNRQIGTQFFECTAGASNPATLLARGRKARPRHTVSVQDEIRNPYLLEFLNLKDEYRGAMSLREPFRAAWRGGAQYATAQETPRPPTPSPSRCAAQFDGVDGLLDL